MSNPAAPFTWLSTNRVHVIYDGDDGDCVLWWQTPKQPYTVTAPTLAEAVAQARGSAEESSGDAKGDQP